MAYINNHNSTSAGLRRERSRRKSFSWRWLAEHPFYEAWSFGEEWCITQDRAKEGFVMALSDFFDADPTGAVGTNHSLDDDEFTTRWPAIWELVTSQQWPDGKKREVSTLLLYPDGGLWKVRLSERNHHLDLWTSAATFLLAMDQLEAVLHHRPVPWRKQGTPNGRGR